MHLSRISLPEASGRDGRQSNRETGKKQDKPKGKRTLQKWTPEEKATFLEVFKEHGKNWELLKKMIPNKSISQVGLRTDSAAQLPYA